MAVELRKISVRINSDVYNQLEIIAAKRGDTISDVTRDLINAGLNERVLEENTDLIGQIVRQQIDAVMKVHVERLAKLSSKTGHMAATAAFLNVQALMDIVPPERRKDVRAMWESARKKAAAYIKTPTSEFENEFGE